MVSLLATSLYSSSWLELDDHAEVTLSLCLSSLIHTIVRTFDFQFPNITIPEPDGPAEICITMDGGTLVPINVTAMTGPKSGVSDQATGIFCVNSLKTVVLRGGIYTFLSS